MSDSKPAQPALADDIRKVSDTVYTAGKEDGIAIGNQQAIIREGNIISAVALELANAGDFHGAKVLREFGTKMLQRAMERWKEETR